MESDSSYNQWVCPWAEERPLLSLYRCTWKLRFLTQQWGMDLKHANRSIIKVPFFPFFLPSRGLCMWPPNQKPCFEYFLGISAIWWIEQLPQPLAFSARTSLLLSAVLPWRPLLQGIPCLHKSAFWREFHKATDKFQQMIPFVPCLLESFSAQAIIQ